MIIDATERFKTRRSKQHNLRDENTNPGALVSLGRWQRTRDAIASRTKTGATGNPDQPVHDHSLLLRETFGTLVFHSHEITETFYKRIVGSQWWDRPTFTTIVNNDSSRLMSALMGMAYDPPRPVQLERFLCEARRRFGRQAKIPREDSEMAAVLISAIKEVKWQRWDEATQMAWRDALQADRIFAPRQNERHDQA